MKRYTRLCAIVHSMVKSTYCSKPLVRSANTGNLVHVNHFQLSMDKNLFFLAINYNVSIMEKLMWSTSLYE